MSNFIKDSAEELDHVVWPTNAESKKYMVYTVGTIIVLAIFLAIIGYVLQSGLKWVRDQFDHAPIVVSSGSDLATQADLEALETAIEKQKVSQSGITLDIATGSTGSGK